MRWGRRKAMIADLQWSTLKTVGSVTLIRGSALVYIERRLRSALVSHSTSSRHFTCIIYNVNKCCTLSCTKLGHQLKDTHFTLLYSYSLFQMNEITKKKTFIWGFWYITIAHVIDNLTLFSRKIVKCFQVLQVCYKFILLQVYCFLYKNVAYIITTFEW